MPMSVDIDTPTRPSLVSLQELAAALPRFLTDGNVPVRNDTKRTSSSLHGKRTNQSVVSRKH